VFILREFDDVVGRFFGHRSALLCCIASFELTLRCVDVRRQRGRVWADLTLLWGNGPQQPPLAIRSGAARVGTAAGLSR
jgi:hypothetical protein